jgi:glycosyltransferase involved in cell wall biosynthesis
MRITIDCRLINASGVGVYLQGCLPYFLNSPHTFVFLGDTEKLRGLVQAYQNYEIIPCTAKPFSISELLAFPKHIKKTVNRTDLYYAPYFNIPGGITVPVYATIHDIIFPDMPELTSKTGLAARMFFFRRAFRRSKKIFTVSKFSKYRIEHFLGNTKPVIVTHSAIQPYLLHRDNLNIQKKEIILFIGNIKKHKGLRCLLDAFFLARHEGLRHKLVIVGDKDNFRSADAGSLRKLEYIDPSIVELTGHIAEDKLKALLAETALLVQPSLYEGFGLPPLEAMIAGTRALVSDIPVFKEIYAGFPVTFFRAGDPLDLKEKLLALLYNKPAETVTLSEQLSNMYTFQKTASIVLAQITLGHL